MLLGLQSIKAGGRDAFFANLDVDPEWEKVWSKHPNPDAYIHSNARFFKSIK